MSQSHKVKLNIGIKEKHMSQSQRKPIPNDIGQPTPTNRGGSTPRGPQSQRRADASTLFWPFSSMSDEKLRGRGIITSSVGSAEADLPQCDTARKRPGSDLESTGGRSPGAVWNCVEADERAKCGQFR